MTTLRNTAACWELCEAIADAALDDIPADELDAAAQLLSRGVTEAEAAMMLDAAAGIPHLTGKVTTARHLVERLGLLRRHIGHPAATEPAREPDPPPAVGHADAVARREEIDARIRAARARGLRGPALARAVLGMDGGRGERDAA